MSYLFRAGFIYIQGEAKFFLKDHVGFYTYNSQVQKEDTYLLPHLGFFMILRFQKFCFYFEKTKM